MKQAGRYPVPEYLLHKPDNYNLKIDFLMHDAYMSNSDEEKSNHNTQNVYDTIVKRATEILGEGNFKFS